MILFLLFWSAITLLFDGLVLGPATRQVIAQNYPSTEGTLLSSGVTKHRGSKGTSYGVAVRYNYFVNDQPFTGTRYRYPQMSSSDSAWAYAVVRSFPPGRHVQVFYDPANPRNSVLATGLLGSDLFMVAFMTPFNAVMLALWWGPWARLRRSWFKPPSGVKITTSLRTTRVRLVAWSPLAIASATVAVLAFLSIFPVALFGGGFHPSMNTMLVTWAIILGGGLAAGTRQLLKVASGKYDLLLDEINGTLELPATQGRTQRRRVALRDIEGAYVETVQQPLKANRRPNAMYAPTLRIQGSTPATEQLVQWWDQDKAARFVEWLQSKLPQAVSLEAR